jgi:glycosyltransferase involved in cell wall biosynthesis
MLSVVIPALNAATSLTATLASVAGADEVLVVDGRSNDGTPDIADSLGAVGGVVRRGRAAAARCGGARREAALLHADTAPGWRGARRWRPDFAGY